jgi:stalled ribosome rescue protein Dom34
MKFLRLLRAVLREIFEEAAYERFCAERRVTQSRSSYSKFLSEVKKHPKVKCC